MGDSLDLPRIDPLPGRDPRGTVSDSRGRPSQKRRQAPHRQAAEETTEDEDRQVGSRLDVRA